MYDVRTVQKHNTVIAELFFEKYVWLLQREGDGQREMKEKDSKRQMEQR